MHPLYRATNRWRSLVRDSCREERFWVSKFAGVERESAREGQKHSFEGWPLWQPDSCSYPSAVLAAAKLDMRRK